MPKKNRIDILLVFLRNYSLAWPLFFDSTSIRKKYHLHDDRVIILKLLLENNIFMRQYINWTLIIVVDFTESLEKFPCFFMESWMNYDHPIKGDPTNNIYILDSRYAFRVLRDTRISLDKSLPYLFQTQTNIFKSCFSCDFFLPFFFIWLLTLR